MRKCLSIGMDPGQILLDDAKVLEILLFICMYACLIYYPADLHLNVFAAVVKLFYIYYFELLAAGLVASKGSVFKRGKKEGYIKLSLNSS